MINLGKWVLYVFVNIGVMVVYGSMCECVCFVYEGKVWFDDWNDGYIFDGWYVCVG